MNYPAWFWRGLNKELADYKKEHEFCEKHQRLAEDSSTNELLALMYLASQLYDAGARKYRAVITWFLVLQTTLLAVICYQLFS